MQSIREAPFDQLAEEYDALWTDAVIGSSQRRAVWKQIDRLFKPGEFVLDLGCGTGVDAKHLESRGTSVFGIDRSPRMVVQARKRGIDAHCLEIEKLGRFSSQFDGALSNFGALNCVPSLARVAATIARLVRPGGYIAVCMMSRVCLWEIGYYLARRDMATALRRLEGRAESSLGFEVFYPRKEEVRKAFTPEFSLLQCHGIGLCVPPSYVTLLKGQTVNCLAAVDAHIASWPLLRSLADHSLYVFQRV